MYNLKRNNEFFVLLKWLFTINWILQLLGLIMLNTSRQKSKGLHNLINYLGLTIRMKEKYLNQSIFEIPII